MTLQEARLRRLATLHARQHDTAVAMLHTANAALHVVDAEIKNGQDEVEIARIAMGVALRAADQQEWRMARAQAEWSGRSVDRCMQRRDVAERAVADAAVCEAEARRESKQMNVAVEYVRSEREQRSARVEQLALDEAARHMRPVMLDFLPMRRMP